MTRPVNVCPMPAGSLMPRADMFRAGGFYSESHALEEIKAGNAPPLPFSQRYGGVPMVFTDAAEQWLEELAALRLSEAERKAAQAAQRRRDEQDALALRIAIFERQAAEGRRQQAAWRDSAERNAARFEERARRIRGEIP